MVQRDIVFLVNLLQDVNILRGLVYLAARETDARLRFLISTVFLKRDSLQIWQKELAQIAAEVRAETHVFDSPADMHGLLQGRAGLIFAASESNLNAHRETRDAFRVAPSSYLKITLQHGLECIGFLQSREHVISHGRDISFNADVVCAWLQPERLSSMIASERSKLYVTGPPTLLQQPRPHPDHPPQSGGMVCENMHSVRLQASGDHKASFMDIFFEFCAAMRRAGRDVTLRPHPGGQYVLKNKIDLPANVQLNNLPMYHVNLSGYQYGISAPSTVVLDMVLVGIPVGVWRDPGGIMDAENYDGLTEISTLEDWQVFERDSRERPEMLLARQRTFLDRLGMPADPAEIYRRFVRLMVSGLELGRAPVPALQAASAFRSGPKAAPVSGLAAAPPRRVLFVVNAVIPTLQLSFLKPLGPLFSARRMEHAILTEADLNTMFGADRRSDKGADWFTDQIAAFAPDLIVCCRYSGPHPGRVLRYAAERGIPVVFHIDDDLLNIPPEIGEAKYKAHNNPTRLTTVRTLLDGATLVYASTPALKRRFRALQVRTPIRSGSVYCTSRVYRPATPGPVRKIGYMGFDHSHDFEVVLPGLERYLDANPDVAFELFGSIPMPEQLKRFGDRVTEVPPVRDYQAFRQELADRHWDIGICPLAYTPFNSVKANTKWVEYTSSGMAVIATRGLVYDDCAGQGRGLLVGAEEWGEALQCLTDDPDLRYRMVIEAQAHLTLHYSDATLRQQILDVFDEAAVLARESAEDIAPEDLSAPEEKANALS